MFFDWKTKGPMIFRPVFKVQKSPNKATADSRRRLWRQRPAAAEWGAHSRTAQGGSREGVADGGAGH
jgi:hypothetical protein